MATGDTLVERSATGTVHVSFDDGVSWVQFRTENHYRAVREALDREELAHETAAYQQFGAEQFDYLTRCGEAAGK